MIATNEEQFLSHLEKAISWCHERIDVNNPKLCFRPKELEELILMHDNEPESIWLSSEIVSQIIIKRNGNPPKKPLESKVENSRNMTRGGSTCANQDLPTARSWRF